MVPYVSGVIELDGTQGAGARLLLNITDADPDTVKIGDAVQIWFDQVSETFPCPRARMVGGAESKAAAAGATRAGRPRRFGAEDELRLLLDAALAVMERNGYADAAVADILREADLSTRSFYRHFESKDQLLCALYRREAEAAAVRLTAKVEAAPSPRAALDAWIDEILSFGHHRAKAARVAVLGSPGAMRAEGYAEETPCRKLLMAP